MSNTLGDTRINGVLSFSDTATLSNFPASRLTNSSISTNADIARSKLGQDTDSPFNIPLQDFRVWDDIRSIIPAAAANDDLGLVDGTFSTNAHTISAGDCKAATVTRYARNIVALPAEYDDAETVKIRVRAAMETTISDTSCTVDVAAYLYDEDGTLNGSPTDLVSTSPTSMNSLTVANYDFTLTSTSLVAGSIVDFRIDITCVDGATGTVVRPSIYKVALLCDIRG